VIVIFIYLFIYFWHSWSNNKLQVIVGTVSVTFSSLVFDFDVWW